MMRVLAASRRQWYDVGRNPRLHAMCFLLPAIVVVAAVFLAPVMYSLRVSFYDWSLVVPGSESTFVGVDNYAWLLRNGDFYSAVRVTLIYALVAIAIELPLGLSFALLLNQTFYFRSVFRAIMIIPMVLTPAVLGIFWKLFYDPGAGLFNYLLSVAGLPRLDWLGLHYALLSCIVMDVWQMSPFFMLILLAGLQSLDQEQIEAAAIDGAGYLQVFRFLTLPHLLPYILIACSFRLIGVLGDFDKIFLLTAGGPGEATTTLSIFAYNLGFSAFEISRTAAIAWVYLVIVLTVSSPLMFYLQRHAFGDR
jgi:multiple sugar transport system permease protein/sorbitol/mannitol transport system permease protein